MNLAGKAGATLFFGNLSIDMDEKTLMNEIEQFTGDVSFYLSSVIKLTSIISLPSSFCSV